MTCSSDSQIALSPAIPSPHLGNGLICSSLLSFFGVLSLNLLYSPAIGQELNAAHQTQIEGRPTPALVSQTSSDTPTTRPILQIGSTGTFVSEVQGMLKLLGYYDGPIDGLYEAETALAVSSFQQAAGLAPDGIVGPVTWSRLLPSTSANTPTTSGNSPSSTPSADPTSPSPSGTPPIETNPTPRPTPSPSPSPSPAPTQSGTPTAPGNPSYVELPILRVGMRGPAITRLQERLRAAGFFDGVIDGIFGAETEAAVRAVQRNYQLDPDGVVGPATWTVLLR